MDILKYFDSLDTPPSPRMSMANEKQPKPSYSDDIETFLLEHLYKTPILNWKIFFQYQIRYVTTKANKQKPPSHLTSLIYTYPDFDMQLVLAGYLNTKIDYKLDTIFIIYELEPRNVIDENANNSVIFYWKQDLELLMVE